MGLWRAWFRCVQGLRPACARRSTFFWMTLVLAGLSIRADGAGVSSFVRVLGLKSVCYRRLLHLCHSRALVVGTLTACWVRLAQGLFTPLRVNGRLVVVDDGLKVAKEGRKMPAVKKLHQSSQNNSKATYIFGHSFQALGLLARGALGHLCCVPLASRIHEGLVFSNRHHTRCWTSSCSCCCHSRARSKGPCYRSWMPITPAVRSSAHCWRRTITC